MAMSQSSSPALPALDIDDAARYGLEDFPGCESFHLPASELDHYEGRLEFWDGDSETAWKVCEPTSIYHEQPPQRLARMAERVAALRVSPIVGAREGTSPEHDPLTRSVSIRAQAKGHAQGHQTGYTQGHRDGRTRGRMDAVAAVLRARGIEVATNLIVESALFHGLSDDALMAAAVACTGESDLRRRLREQRDLQADLPPCPDPEA